jgi:hypothetical protein
MLFRTIISAYGELKSSRIENEMSLKTNTDKSFEQIIELNSGKTTFLHVLHL